MAVAATIMLRLTALVSLEIPGISDAAMEAEVGF